MALRYTGWCSRLVSILALVCIVVVHHHAAGVHGLTRAELVIGPATAPPPVPAPSVDTAKERLARTAAAQTSKWRVRRGSDPIHNRS
ncbi:hypothetical protein GUJ93_ZPchr0003g17687 [Zizania palustris]|uniref:Uncharacterized protein n=1 Tax=Zizania palustris TaxID=103762 RepID=A0A8J5SWC0_ZIZPA|nr:hypothetical protein GUJ93_ZPchr0003g17687 [Zizania palustris]